MTARSRILTSITTTMNSAPANLRIIIFVLICALVCLLGLAVLICRCSYFRLCSSKSVSPASTNKGLKKKVLNSLQKFTYSKSDRHTEKLLDCAICVTEFVNGEEIRVLPKCGHGFHVECIDMWLASHSSCPSCRQVLVVVVEPSEISK